MADFLDSGPAYEITRNPQILSNIGLISSTIQAFIVLLITLLVNIIRVRLVATPWWKRRSEKLKGAFDLILARGGIFEVLKGLIVAKPSLHVVFFVLVLILLAQPLGLVFNAAYFIKEINSQIVIDGKTTTEGWSNCGNGNLNAAERNIRCEKWNQIRIRYLLGYDPEENPEYVTLVNKNMSRLFNARFPDNMIPIDTTIASTTVTAIQLPFNRSLLRPEANFAISAARFQTGCTMTGVVFPTSENSSATIGPQNTSFTESLPFMDSFETYYRPRMILRENLNNPVLNNIRILQLSNWIKINDLEGTKNASSAIGYLIRVPLASEFAIWWLNSEEFLGGSVLPQFRYLAGTILTLTSVGNGKWATYPPDTEILVGLSCLSTASYRSSHVTVRQGGAAGLWLDSYRHYDAPSYYSAVSEYDLVYPAEMAVCTNSCQYWFHSYPLYKPFDCFKGIE